MKASGNIGGEGPRAGGCQRAAALIAACALLWPFLPARAQEEENEELEEEFELIEQQADIVTSAAKHEQKIGQSPSAVVVITRKEIEASGAVTLADLLRRWPVTHIYESDPIYPSMDVRTNYRVLLLIDGREANHEFFVSAFYAMLPLGLQEVERIEIVLGPSSAMYGANAVSAVVNIITRKPKAEPGAVATLAAGEHGRMELDLRVSGGAGPVTASLSGGTSRSNAWMESGRAAEEVWRADATSLIDLGEAQFRLDSGFSLATGNFFGIVSDIFIDDVWATHADVSFKYKDFQLRSYWYGMRGHVTLDMDMYYPQLDAVLGRIPAIDITGDTVHNEAQLNLDLLAGNLLILGADVRYTRYHSPQLVKDTVSEMRAGAYFHDEQHLGEKWQVQAGLRFDWNSRTDFALSPRG